LPNGFDPETFLAPYVPFTETGADALPVINLKVEIVETLRSVVTGQVKEVFNDEAPYFWLFESHEGRFNFGFSYSKNNPDCILIPSEDYKTNTVYVPSAHAAKISEFALSNSMMLLYTFNTTCLETLMVHASVVGYEGGAYMFLGRSGTGKSTHSSLWLKNIGGTYLLNDDNPVIRVENDQINIYGTPWSGKTPCYKNEVLPLKAVVRLSQAPHNEIRQLSLLHSYASLMPACSCMRWDSKSTEALHKTVEKVISKVRCWHLECLPDADAARICHEAVTK
jgi:hypothetical protein